MEKILNVLYQSNDLYAPVAGVSLTSLLKNSKDVEIINIYLLNDNISGSNLTKFEEVCKQYGRVLFVIDAQKILKRCEELQISTFRGTHTAFLKLLAVESLELPSDYVLFLDADTIINKSLKKLLELELSYCACAAVYDCILNRHKELIGIDKNDVYYNSGVMYINQKNWIAQNYESKIVNHLQNVRSRYFLPDQDLLNTLFRKEMKCLEPAYNFNSGFYIYGVDESMSVLGLKPEYYYTTEELQAAYDSPAIYHCMGAMTGRPWEKDSIHPQNELFDQYLSVSPWSSYEKIAVKRSFVFRIQRMLYLSLPKKLYLSLHKMALNFYHYKMDKNAKEHKN